MLLVQWMYFRTSIDRLASDRPFLGTTVKSPSDVSAPPLLQAAGAGIASAAKALKAQTAAVAIVGLPDLSDADKVDNSSIYLNGKLRRCASVQSCPHLPHQNLAAQADALSSPFVCVCV
jgi:hypothetical protein